jgi:hypothetical protein
MAVRYFSTFSGKRNNFQESNVIEYKMCFYFLHSFCFKHSSFEELSEICSRMYIGLQVKYALLLLVWNDSKVISTNCGKIFNIKFGENPSNGNRVVSCGWTGRQTDGRMDRHNELMVTLRNFTNAHKKKYMFYLR